MLCLPDKGISQVNHKSRLFVLERTTLADMERDVPALAKGDRVLFLRDAQNLDGAAAEALSAKGVEVIRGPDLLRKADIRKIETFLDGYLKGWFLEKGEDISRDGGLSLGQFFSGQLASIQKPPLIVVLGEICRRALEGMAPGGTVLCDIRDGWTPFANQVPVPEISPRCSLVKAWAEAAGQTYQDFPVVRPLPDIHRTDERTGSTNPYITLARAFVGGFRPTYLLARLKAALGNRDKPGVYVYFNHGLRLIAEVLTERGDLRVYGDRTDIPGIVPLRYDHLWAMPSRSLRKAAFRLRQRLEILATQKKNLTLVFDGFDYGAFLLPGIRALLERRLPTDLIRISQGFKLMRRFGINLTVINGDTAAMYAAIGNSRESDHRVVYVDHGLNLYHQGLRNVSLNQPHVAYVTHGTDHLQAYGSDLPEQSKPRRPLLGNPAFALMDKIRDLRADPPGRRVLMANYTPHYANHCGRFHDYDSYMRDLLTAARVLLNQGATVTYRPHHGENPPYITHMIEAMGLTGRVTVDGSGSFEEALSGHDVFVANTTSCIYQALYAGWPTVFFDLGMDMDYLIGMPAATDIFRPIAQTSEQLVEMVGAAFDPASEVSQFPARFKDELGHRFVGSDAALSHQAIADFISRELGMSAVENSTRRAA